MPPRPATTTQADAEAANTTQTQTSTTQSNVTSGGSNVTTSFIENEGEVPAIAPATANCTPAILVYFLYIPIVPCDHAYKYFLLTARAR